MYFLPPALVLLTGKSYVALWLWSNVGSCARTCQQTEAVGRRVPPCTPSETCMVEQNLQGHCRCMFTCGRCGRGWRGTGCSFLKPGREKEIQRGRVSAREGEMDYRIIALMRNSIDDWEALQSRRHEFSDSPCFSAGRRVASELH